MLGHKSLRKLKIVGCKSLWSLPPSMEYLTSLESHSALPDVKILIWLWRKRDEVSQKVNQLSLRVMWLLELPAAKALPNRLLGSATPYYRSWSAVVTIASSVHLLLVELSLPLSSLFWILAVESLFALISAAVLGQWELFGSCMWRLYVSPCLALPSCFGFLEKLILLVLNYGPINYWRIFRILWMLLSILSDGLSRGIFPFGSRQLSIFWLIMTEEHRNFWHPVKRLWKM